MGELIQLLILFFHKNIQLEMSTVFRGLQVTSEYNENNGLRVYLLESEGSGLEC